MCVFSFCLYVHSKLLWLLKQSDQLKQDFKIRKVILAFFWFLWFTLRLLGFINLTLLANVRLPRFNQFKDFCGNIGFFYDKQNIPKLNCLVIQHWCHGTDLVAEVPRTMTGHAICYWMFHNAFCDSIWPSRVRDSQMTNSWLRAMPMATPPTG